MSIGTITLKVDGVQVTVPEGTTILEAAKKAGIHIPTLCYLEGLTSWGGCRICMVEIHGNPKLFPACATPANMGMEVVTQSEKLTAYRKTALEFLLSERTHICSVCVANNSCELQKLANELGVDHVGYERGWTSFPLDSSHDFLVLDRNRCILCTRCIRVCNEIEGVHTLDTMMRGKDAQIIVDLDEPWGDSKTCTSCRKCAKVCPVGAIYVESKPLSEVKDSEIAKFILSRRNK